MFIALAQSPCFVLNIAVGISFLVLSAAARSRNHHETATAFVDRTPFRFSGGTAQRSALQFQFRRGTRRWPTSKRSIISTSTTQWSIPPDVEDSGEEGGDGGMDGEFVPTEELLDDPSYVEQILSAMGRLAPGVPPVDKPVFQTAVKHHCALRTSNIIRAMKFYSLLGMKEVVRFRADSARCAFLEGAGLRLELIEVPASMQPEAKAPDLTVDMRSTGLNHIAFDVGPAIDGSEDGLRGFLTELNRQSEEIFGMSVRLAVSPFEQRIGQEVYDIAFITDADGVLLELLHRKITLDMDMPQAW